MSILETFYVLFKSNSTELIKGNDEVEKSTKKLQNKLNQVEDASTRVGQSFLSMAAGFTALLASAFSVHKLVTGFSDTLDYANKLNLLSKQLNIGVSDLDAWSQAVKFAGGTTEGFISSLQSLSQHLGGNAQVAFKALPLLADAFTKLGRVRSQQYGKMLGLDQSTIFLLQQGRREVEDVIKKMKEFGVVSKENADLSSKLNIEILKNDLAFRGLYLSLFSEIIPILESFFKITSKIANYLSQHKDLVVGAFLAMAAGALIFSGVLLYMNPIFTLIAGSIVLLTGLLAVAYEDIKYYIQGHQSLIGDILKRWPLVGESIKFVIDRIKELWNNLKLVNDLFLKLENFISNFSVDKLKEIGKNILQGKYSIDLAGKFGLGSQTSNSILNSGYNKNNNLTIGDVVINANSTDGTGIAQDFMDGIKKHTWQSNSYFDTGNNI
jgi:hypothetical protein